MHNYQPVVTDTGTPMSDTEFCLIDGKRESSYLGSKVLSLATISSIALSIQGNLLNQPALLYYGVISAPIIGTIGAVWTHSVAKKDPRFRKIINQFNKRTGLFDQIPENPLPETIIRPTTSQNSFGETIGALANFADEQNLDTNQFTLALNHLISATEPPEEMDNVLFRDAQEAVSRSLDYKNEKFSEKSPFKELLLLSYLGRFLRRNPEVLPRVDREIFSQRYDDFCDQKLIPYHTKKFGDVQTRFINLYVEQLRPLTRDPEALFDFDDFQRKISVLRDFHGKSMSDDPRFSEPSPTQDPLPDEENPFGLTPPPPPIDLYQPQITLRASPEQLSTQGQQTTHPQVPTHP